MTILLLRRPFVRKSRFVVDEISRGLGYSPDFQASLPVVTSTPRPTTRAYNNNPGFDSGTPIFRPASFPKRPRDGPEPAPRVYPDSSMLDFSESSSVFGYSALSYVRFLVDNHSVQNVYVTDVLSRAHNALAAFCARAETEDALHEVCSDLKMQMVRAIHRISVEVSFFETLNKEFGLVRGTMAQLSKPIASGSGSSQASA